MSTPRRIELERSRVAIFYIVLPYDKAETATERWANEEDTIEFFHDPVRSTRCTISFAAVELEHYLSKTLPEACISYSSRRREPGVCIELKVVEQSSRSDEFSIEPRPQGVLIEGKGRTGLLFGVYELLRLQGWRWYTPGEVGEVAPSTMGVFVKPISRVAGKPSMNAGRGLDLEGISKESAELLLWMARNRLNVAGARPQTRALCAKLGLMSKRGGHIFEALLNPDRVLPTGKTLWEEHEEWYGMPAGRPRCKDKALETQFCVSQPDLTVFLGNEILSLLSTTWSDADRLDVWGFDTWGDTCSCTNCKAVGNSTDQMLHFVSQLRGFLNTARLDNRLDRDVQLIMCAYEGTSTLHAPTAPIPRNLIDAGDLCVYYPIRRCYSHDFQDPACPDNSPYQAALGNWCKRADGLSLVVGEYYNVSKFEDLPLIFARRVSADIPRYHRMGIRGITYMHVPLVNWGVRTLTQVLYAQMAWDTESDVESFIDDFFLRWYGPFATEMRRVYEMVEEAWSLVSSWRSWGQQSVLSQLMVWDGGRPAESLPVSSHFGDAMGAVQSGRSSLQSMQRAIDTVHRLRASEKGWSASRTSPVFDAAVNEIEAEKPERTNGYELRIGEDGRSIIYGRDTMLIMTDLVEYHETLVRDDALAADALWRRIEATADRLDSYYVPIGFQTSAAGFVSSDALTRTQLRPLLRRCRSYRLRTGRRAGEVSTYTTIPGEQEWDSPR